MTARHRGLLAATPTAPSRPPPGRPGLQDRARYYAVVYLNQMVLSHRQPPGQKQGESWAAATAKSSCCLPMSYLQQKMRSALCGAWHTVQQ